MDLSTLLIQVTVAALTGVLVPLIGFNARVLVWLGRLRITRWGFRPFSPNWITVYSTVITLVGFACFTRREIVPAAFLIGFGGILDRLDGRAASAQSHAQICPDPPIGLWHEFNFPGKTDLGTVLDPAADKIKNLVMLVWFSLHALVEPWLTVILFVPELLGTLMRRPFFLLSSYQHTPRATSVGKWKAIMQWMVIIVAIPFHEQWLSDAWSTREQYLIVNAFMTASIVLAWLSLLSRLRFVRTAAPLKHSLDELDDTFSHED